MYVGINIVVTYNFPTESLIISNQDVLIVSTS